MTVKLLAEVETTGETTHFELHEVGNVRRDIDVVTIDGHDHVLASVRPAPLDAREVIGTAWSNPSGALLCDVVIPGVTRVWLGRAYERENIICLVPTESAARIIAAALSLEYRED